MGFHRTVQPDPPPITISIDQAVEDQIAQLIDIHSAARDPFNVADRCEFNPTGHQTIVSCGDVVCCHCAKVFWR